MDQAALIACLAYIDLNPIRAKVADRLVTSKHASGYRRIRARNRHRAAEMIKRRETKRAAALLAKAGLSKHAAHPEDGLWLTPLARCQVGEPLANKSFTVDEYLTLLDATGRMLKAGKRGAIPPELAPILARLDLSVDAWLATMLGWRMFAFTSAIGTFASRLAEAGKRKLGWIRNRCPLFVERPAATAVACYELPEFTNGNVLSHRSPSPFHLAPRLNRLWLPVARLARRSGHRLMVGDARDVFAELGVFAFQVVGHDGAEIFTAAPLAHVVVPALPQALGLPTHVLFEDQQVGAFEQCDQDAEDDVLAFLLIRGQRHLHPIEV